MSHFAVLVIGSNVEEQLRPFQENNMGDCPAEYMEFNDITEKYTEKYEKQSSRCLVNAEGKAFSPYEDQFLNPKYTIFSNSDEKQFIVPEGFTEKEIPFKEQYATFELFMKEYCGEDEKDEKTGKYGYWENPNAKWDWYQIGGRYAGRLLLKAGAEGVSGKRSRFDDSPLPPPGFVDQAKVGDLDFEGMLAKRRSDRVKWWAEYEAAIAKIPNPTAQDIAWEKMKVGIEGETKEEYLKVDEPLSTFAVLKDGKWYEKGEMGWWAIVSGEMSDQEWATKVNELLKDLPPDETITFVDCHI